MNLKLSLRYQLHDCKKAIIIFYAIVFAVLLLMTLSISFPDSNIVTVKGRLGGMEIATAIFLFVAGLNSFRETFRMFLQNSISRKTMFIGRLVSVSTISLGMALIDSIISTVFKKLVPINSEVNYESIIETMYRSRYEINSSGVSMYLEKVLFSLCLYAAVSMIGYFITTLYYRTGKGAKIAVSVGVPAGLFIALPIVDASLFHGEIGRAFGDLISFAFGYSNGANPYYGMVTLLLIFAVFSALSWLLARKAVIKD